MAVFAPPPNLQGAPNSLFAPPYIPGNPQAVAAATAYNAAKQAQINPMTPPGPVIQPNLFGARPFSDRRNMIAQTMMQRRGARL